MESRYIKAFMNDVSDQYELLQSLKGLQDNQLVSSGQLGSKVIIEDIY